MKTKALNSCAVLICGFVFAYAKIRFSHDAAHIMLRVFNGKREKTTDGRPAFHFTVALLFSDELPRENTIQPT